jgi:hypothetical protein
MPVLARPLLCPPSVTRAACITHLRAADGARCPHNHTSNRRSPLCWCIGDQSPNKVFGSAQIQNLCKNRCQACSDAAKKCKSPNDPLPEACASGLNFSPMVKGLVDTCYTTYQKDPKSVSRATKC